MTTNHVPQASPAVPPRAGPRPGARVKMIAVLGGVGLYFTAQGAYYWYQQGEMLPARIMLLALLMLVFVGALLMLFESRGDRRRLGPGFLFLATLRVAGWLTLFYLAWLLLASLPVQR
jgi:hypothetical protein